MVNKEGIFPSTKKVQAIYEIAPPTHIKELQRFLGMINFYRVFIPNFAHVASPKDGFGVPLSKKPLSI